MRGAAPDTLPASLHRPSARGHEATFLRHWRLLGLGHDIGTAWRRGPGVWRDIAIASWELALANWEFRRTPWGELALLLAADMTEGSKALTALQRSLVERVAYAVPIMGLRVPWRSDCVVQALAARRWLARRKIASSICIGVRKDEQGFQAHAWLRVGDRIVTGGDISSYSELPPSRVPQGLFAR
jgi:hypothetical protein